MSDGLFTPHRHPSTWEAEAKESLREKQELTLQAQTAMTERDAARDEAKALRVRVEALEVAGNQLVEHMRKDGKVSASTRRGVQYWICSTSRQWRLFENALQQQEGGE